MYVVVETAEAVLPEGDVVQTEAGTDVVYLYGSSCSVSDSSRSIGGGVLVIIIVVVAVYR